VTDAEHPAGWADDDPRWNDERATVRFRPSPPPTARLTRPAAPVPWRDRRPARPASVAALGSLALVVGLVWLAVAPGSSSGSDPVEATSRDRPPPDAEPCPEPAGGETANDAGDTVGRTVVLIDGCERHLHHDRATAVLTIEGIGRFSLGEVDDWLVVGDWACDGASTPALYRPGDGTVHRFAGWTLDEPTSSDRVIDAGITEAVPDVERHGDCDRLALHPPPAPNR
jgi:hypothetical protein